MQSNMNMSYEYDTSMHMNIWFEYTIWILMNMWIHHMNISWIWIYYMNLNRSLPYEYDICHRNIPHYYAHATWVWYKYAYAYDKLVCHTSMNAQVNMLYEYECKYEYVIWIRICHLSMSYFILIWNTNMNMTYECITSKHTRHLNITFEFWI